MAGAHLVFVDPTFRFDPTCSINCTSMAAFSCSALETERKQNVSHILTYPSSLENTTLLFTEETMFSVSVRF